MPAEVNRRLNLPRPYGDRLQQGIRTIARNGIRKRSNIILHRGRRLKDMAGPPAQHPMSTGRGTRIVPTLLQ